MPSFISSSKSRCPDGPWRNVLAGILLMFIVVCGTAEIGLRLAGYRSTVIDDPDLWAIERDRAADVKDSQVFVLLGASRMQLGFDPATFQKRYSDYQIVQLAVAGAHPMATLNELAEDESFTGIILCGVSPESFLEKNWNEQVFHVDYYQRQFSLNKSINKKIALFFERNFVLLDTRLRFDRLLLDVIDQGELPGPNYLVTYPDRSRKADYTKFDIERHTRERFEFFEENMDKENPVTPEAWLRQVRKAESYVERIQERGGRVVYMHFPITGLRWEYSESSFPKSEYWDRMAEVTSALTVHFRDYSELARFRCPDSSHLDRRDVGAFTGSLLDILESEGVIKP